MIVRTAILLLLALIGSIIIGLSVVCLIDGDDPAKKGY